METQYAIINGTLTAINEAKLGIDDLSIVRGYAIFDYFKTINNIPIFWEDNLDRFFNSAKLMDLPIRFSREEIKNQILLLIEKNNIPHSGIKILLTGGYSQDGYTIADPNLIITQQFFIRDTIREKSGMKLHLFDFHRAFGTVKSIDYVMGIKALKVAREYGADDVLYFQNNLLSECPRANIFLVMPDDTVITPNTDVLFGITKKHILEMSKDIIRIEDRPVSIEDLKNAREAFITSTTKNITPVTSIVGLKEFELKDGSITQQLQDLLDKHTEAYIRSYKI